MFADITDAGPDQAARRKQVKTAISASDDIFGCTFYFDHHCLLHQYHIIVREGLQLIDAFLEEVSDVFIEYGFRKYYGSQRLRD